MWCLHGFEIATPYIIHETQVSKKMNFAYYGFFPLEIAEILGKMAG